MTDRHDGLVKLIGSFASIAIGAFCVLGAVLFPKEVLPPISTFAVILMLLLFGLRELISGFTRLPV